MRRIIERVVTVVTTTTWKISWEADPSQPDHPNGHPSPDVLSESVYDAEASPQVIETKEVEPLEREEKMIDPTVE